MFQVAGRAIMLHDRDRDRDRGGNMKPAQQVTLRGREMDCSGRRNWSSNRRGQGPAVWNKRGGSIRIIVDDVWGETARRRSGSRNHKQSSAHRDTHSDAHEKASANRDSWQTITQSHQWRLNQSSSLSLSLQTPKVLPQPTFSPGGIKLHHVMFSESPEITAAKLFSVNERKVKVPDGEGFYFNVGVPLLCNNSCGSCVQTGNPSCLHLLFFSK